MDTQMVQVSWAGASSMQVRGLKRVANELFPTLQGRDVAMPKVKGRMVSVG